MRDPVEVQKKKARDAVTRAIMSGRLTPGPCSKCDRSPEVVKNRQIIHAHHPRGYSDDHLLDIEWLCSLCHRQEHVDLPPFRRPIFANAADDRAFRALDEKRQ